MLRDTAYQAEVAECFRLDKLHRIAEVSIYQLIFIL
jgi:hypothetical protein